MLKQTLKIIILLALAFLLWTFGKSLNMEKTAPDTAPPATETPTSADNTPPGSIHNLPVPDAVSAVRERVAEDLGIEEGLVIVMSAFKKDWPDSCLGLAGEGEFCAQVITPGYEVAAQAQGREFVYRVNSDGSILRQEK